MTIPHPPIADCVCFQVRPNRCTPPRLPIHHRHHYLRFSPHVYGLVHPQCHSGDIIPFDVVFCPRQWADLLVEACSNAFTARSASVVLVLNLVSSGSVWMHLRGIQDWYVFRLLFAFIDTDTEAQHSTPLSVLPLFCKKFRSSFLLRFSCTERGASNICLKVDGFGCRHGWDGLQMLSRLPLERSRLHSFVSPSSYL